MKNSYLYYLQRAKKKACFIHETKCSIKQLLEVKNMRDEIINSIEGLEENYGEISQR